jgi:non-homologous end joining protein Ku
VRAVDAMWDGGLTFGAVTLPVRMRMGPGVAMETPRSVEILGLLSDGKLAAKPLVAPCYLAPADPGCRGYSVLCQVLAATGHVALARVPRKNGARLVPLRVHMNALVVDLGCW